MLSITLPSGYRTVERGDKTDSYGNCLSVYYDEFGLCDDSDYSKCTDFSTAFIYKTEDTVKCPDGKSFDCKMYCNDGGQCVIADAKGRCVSDGSMNFTYFDNDLPSLNNFAVTDCDGTVIPAPKESHCSDSTETSDASEEESTFRGPISDAVVTVICIGTGVVVLAVIIVMLIVRQIQMRRLDHI